MRAADGGGGAMEGGVRDAIAADRATPPADGCAGLLYADVDGDGFGDPFVSAPSCEAPSAYVARPGDCDDARPSVHDGAFDACNGLDDDCDGAADDGGDCPCPVGYFGRKPYLFCGEGTTEWESARVACSEIESYRLVSIDAVDEATWIEAEVGDRDAARQWWIGLSDVDDEGSWVWTDGATASFTHWRAGEPSEWPTSDREDCCETAPDGWNDEDCVVRDPQPYVCESTALP